MSAVQSYIKHIYTQTYIHRQTDRGSSFMTITKLFSLKEESQVGVEPVPFLLKKKKLMPYSIPSQHLYCFHHRGCWSSRPFGPYFSSPFPILQCSTKQGLCLLQASNSHTLYSDEWYGDILHEGITQTGQGVSKAYQDLTATCRFWYM